MRRCGLRLCADACLGIGGLYRGDDCWWLADRSRRRADGPGRNGGRLRAHHTVGVAAPRVGRSAQAITDYRITEPRRNRSPGGPSTAFGRRDAGQQQPCDALRLLRHLLGSISATAGTQIASLECRRRSGSADVLPCQGDRPPVQRLDDDLLRPACSRRALADFPDGSRLSGYFVLQCFHAFTYAIMHTGMQHKLVERVAEEQEASAQGLYFFYTGIFTGDLHLSVGYFYAWFRRRRLLLHVGGRGFPAAFSLSSAGIFSPRGWLPAERRARPRSEGPGVRSFESSKRSVEIHEIRALRDKNRRAPWRANCPTIAADHDLQTEGFGPRRALRRASVSPPVLSSLMLTDRSGRRAFRGPPWHARFVGADGVRGRGREASISSRPAAAAVR